MYNKEILSVGPTKKGYQIGGSSTSTDACFAPAVFSVAYGALGYS